MNLYRVVLVDKDGKESVVYTMARSDDEVITRVSQYYFPVYYSFKILERLTGAPGQALYLYGSRETQA